MKNQSSTWLRRISFAGSSSVAAVRKLRGASPERRLPIEAPPFARSPSPFETRRMISRASLGWFETLRRLVVLSHHRKPGGPALFLWRTPARSEERRGGKGG